MINKIFTKAIQDFINANLKTDLHSFLLKKSPLPEISIQELAQQIKGRNKAEKKFPFLLVDGIIFPPNINLEQTSSQSTSSFKANLVKGQNLVDLTCGFGIDAYFLSKNFEEITMVEKDENLLNIVKHNWHVLDKKATFVHDTLENFIKQNKEKFDVVYLDPARRSLEKKKVFLLEDLSPNILEIQHQLLEIGNAVITKLSPMIDLSYLVSVMENVARIDIISVKNEVKEILIHQSKVQRSGELPIFCNNLETEEEEFQFYFGEEKNVIPSYADFQKYLYIPNTAILKSGAFNLLSEKFAVKKLHANTQLFTSENLIKNFPGRILEMKIIQAKEIKKGDQWNIISKNHPLSTSEIEKKYKIKQGGTGYLIFTQSISGKIILQSL